MATAERLVLRNGRFQLIGVVSLLFAVGFGVLLYVVATSPANSIDHPGGFTAGGRVLAAIGCIIAVAAFGAYAVASLRVAFIVDHSGLVIRNPWSTTRLGWQSKPRFDIRGRAQDVVVSGPVTTDPSMQRGGKMTYRYREVVCVVGRKHTTIAATSRMSRRDRVDKTLEDIRAACGQFKHESASRAAAAD